jgi:hypothetical protein
MTKNNKYVLGASTAMIVGFVGMEVGYLPMSGIAMFALWFMAMSASYKIP